jgi:hypothetical protein
MKESCTQVSLSIMFSPMHFMHHVMHSIMLKYASFIYVYVHESGKVLIEQVLRRLVLINLYKGVVHQRCWRRSSINGASVVHP